MKRSAFRLLKVNLILLFLKKFASFGFLFKSDNFCLVYAACDHIAGVFSKSYIGTEG
jgi:hypothetical protein